MSSSSQIHRRRVDPLIICHTFHRVRVIYRVEPLIGHYKYGTVEIDKRTAIYWCLKVFGSAWLRGLRLTSLSFCNNLTFFNIYMNPQLHLSFDAHEVSWDCKEISFHFSHMSMTVLNLFACFIIETCGGGGGL